MRVVSSLLLAGALACAPPATSEAQLPEPSGRDVWVLVAHGSGDGPERWALGMAEAIRIRTVMPGRLEVVAYDWRDAAFDKLAAAGNGRQEGAAIADVIAQRSLSHVHVIAHSAGAHLAYGLEQALSTAPRRPTLHVTLLDPFLGEGLDFAWGASRFGAQVDFMDQVLHVGDGVPGTDVAVAAAHAFDVTASRPAGETWAGTKAHWWPTEAYLALAPGLDLALEVSGSFDPTALRERWPPGQTEASP